MTSLIMILLLLMSTPAWAVPTVITSGVIKSPADPDALAHVELHSGPLHITGVRAFVTDSRLFVLPVLSGGPVDLGSSGEFQKGAFFYFPNDEPVFGDAVVIRGVYTLVSHIDAIQVGWNTAPFYADWMDGHLGA